MSKENRMEGGMLSYNIKTNDGMIEYTFYIYYMTPKIVLPPRR